MRGEFINVWADTWHEIWSKLANHEKSPDDLFCELYREIETTFKNRLTIEHLADIVDDRIQSKQVFENIRSEEIASERDLVEFFEKVYEILDDFGFEDLKKTYFQLLLTFIEKFSLRYELRQPCRISPTISGIFTSLMRELKEITEGDKHLNILMKAFEDSICDLRIDCSEPRIKACIHTQCMLLEAIGSKYLDRDGQTLGEICNQIDVPHAALKRGLSSIYGFASNYPGIRHGGVPSSAIRAIKMHDMVVVSILLASFTPYLTDQINADVVYRGKLKA